MKQKTVRKRQQYLTRAALIAALYVVLTYLAAALGLSGTAVVQVRFSEALCVLPYFTSAAIPGLTVGCLLANWLTGAHLLDVLFGTLATLIGALGSYALRRWRFLVPLPPIAANTLIVPYVLRFVYHLEGGLPFFFLTVGAGEIISVGVLGVALMLALEKRKAVLFGSEGQK